MIKSLLKIFSIFLIFLGLSCHSKKDKTCLTEFIKEIIENPKEMDSIFLFNKGVSTTNYVNTKLSHTKPSDGLKSYFEKYNKLYTVKKSDTYYSGETTFHEITIKMKDGFGGTNFLFSFKKEESTWELVDISFIDVDIVN